MDCQQQIKTPVISITDENNHCLPSSTSTYESLLFASKDVCQSFFLKILVF